MKFRPSGFFAFFNLKLVGCHFKSSVFPYDFPFKLASFLYKNWKFVSKRKKQNRQIMIFLKCIFSKISQIKFKISKYFLFEKQKNIYGFKIIFKKNLQIFFKVSFFFFLFFTLIFWKPKCVKKHFFYSNFNIMASFNLFFFFFLIFHWRNFNFTLKEVKHFVTFSKLFVFLTSLWKNRFFPFWNLLKHSILYPQKHEIQYKKKTFFWISI